MSEVKLPHEWWDLGNEDKEQLRSRWERYAELTLPSLVPRENRAKHSAHATTSIGAKLVTHLANRIAKTMYPNSEPFFAVKLTETALAELKEAAQDKYDAIKADLDAGLLDLETQATRAMNLTAYRPKVVEALSLLIVTGNALVRRLPDEEGYQKGRRMVYSPLDYMIWRRVSGEPYRIVLRDMVSRDELNDAKQIAAFDSTDGHAGTESIGAQIKTKPLYTAYSLEADGRWAMEQAIGNSPIGDIKRIKAEEMDCIPLVWRLSRGDHWGSGMIEEQAASFMNLEILEEAQLDIVAISADIKALVKPDAITDINTYNNAKRGEYVAGEEGDVTYPDHTPRVAIDVLEQSIVSTKRELSQAFLMTSSGVRNAERVTAEEIRQLIDELEGTFGGLYSRLALEWQQREAQYELSRLNFRFKVNGKEETYDLTVTSGDDTLSRSGELARVRYAMADLQMVAATPELLLQQLNMPRLARKIFSLHGLKFEEVFMTQDEVTAAQDNEVSQAAAMSAASGEGQVAAQAALGAKPQ